METFVYVSRTHEDTIQFAKELGKLLHLGSVLGLQGPLGAGKTLFTKGFALGIGLTEEITSPTYPIILEYPVENGIFVHMDWYRTTGNEEIEMLGIEEFFDSDHICLIEWSDKATDLLPSHSIIVTIEILNSSERKISTQLSDEYNRRLSDIFKDSSSHE